MHAVYYCACVCSTASTHVLVIIATVRELCTQFRQFNCCTNALQTAFSALACEQDAEQARSMSAEAVKMLSRAYIADKTNCMVLNHLANHYFWTWTTAQTTVSVSDCCFAMSSLRRWLADSELLLTLMCLYTVP
jgi:hypothetical protein